jgi:hypothetical protein
MAARIGGVQAASRAEEADRVNRLLVAALALVVSASAAAAQGTVRFVPRYDFHLSAEHLSQDDPRFVWDTNFGGAIDFVDYGVGRTSFVANYEAVLGNEFRDFDPNQGNYLLDLSTSARSHGYEFAATLHHTSRHLGDRFKRAPVDWNMLGLTVGHDVQRGDLRVRPHGNVLGVILKSNVDYRWEANGGADVRVPVRAHVAVIAGGNLRLVGVDGSRDRDTQTGGRLEGGVRFEGEKGAIELVVATERRIDAYPLDTTALSWVSAGFRFVSR